MTRIDMTYHVLKQHEKIKFTAKELALKVYETYPTEFKEKKQNARFINEDDFISQLAAEISATKIYLLKKEGVKNNDQSRPQIYFYNKLEIEQQIPIKNITQALTSEASLYPLLGSFLTSELNIYSKRIDERKSINSRGPKGNIWLHPDLVGIELLDQNWNIKVKQSIRGAGGTRVKLYSFEVKKKITQSNLREYFFQAVSNSSWANQGFLVAEELKTSSGLFSELKMLSTLHGIGFILLNKNNPSESQTLLPAKEKNEPDWTSINRLVVENSDFEKFITSLKIYYDSGEIHKNDWYS